MPQKPGRPPAEKRAFTGTQRYSTKKTKDVSGEAVGDRDEASSEDESPGASGEAVGDSDEASSEDEPLGVHAPQGGGVGSTAASTAGPALEEEGEEEEEELQLQEALVEHADDRGGVPYLGEQGAGTEQLSVCSGSTSAGASAAVGFTYRAFLEVDDGSLRSTNMVEATNPVIRDLLYPHRKNAILQMKPILKNLCDTRASQSRFRRKKFHFQFSDSISRAVRRCRQQAGATGDFMSALLSDS